MTSVSQTETGGGGLGVSRAPYCLMGREALKEGSQPPASVSQLQSEALGYFMALPLEFCGFHIVRNQKN